MSPEQVALENYHNATRWLALFEGIGLLFTLAALLSIFTCGVMSVLIYRRLGLIQRSVVTRADGIGIAVAGSPAIHAQSERNPQAEAEWSAAMAMLGKSRETDPDRRFMPKG